MRIYNFNNKPMSAKAVSIFLIAACSLTAQSNTFPSSGNVGIGTTNPGARLEIDGGNGTIPLTINNSTDSTVSTPLLFLSQGQGSGAYSRQPAIAFLGPQSISNPSMYYATIRAVDDNGGPGSSSASLRFATAFGDPATLTDRLIVGGNGNVGIGTTSPGAKLDVVGGAAMANNTTLNLDSFGYRILAGGLTDASGWGLSTAIGGNSGIGHSWAIGSNGGDLYMGYQNGASTSSLQTFLEVGTNRNVYLVPTSGNVGIGTTNPTQKLSVNGTVRAKEVVVDTGWSDYVFDENYKVMPLSAVEAAIKQHKHLPGVPSAKEVAEKGISIGEMQAELLEKIEELTLHQIEQEKLLLSQQIEIARLRREVVQLQQAK